MGGAASKPAASTDASATATAITIKQPDDKAASFGAFFGIPKDVFMGVVGRLEPESIGALARASRGMYHATKSTVEYNREYDAFIQYLRQLLRHEAAEVPPILHKYCDSDLSTADPDDAAAADARTAKTINIAKLPPEFQAVFNNCQNLFAAYQAYFEYYLAMYQQYADSRWPTDGMEELDRLFAGVKEKEAALPIKLIQGTGLRVLQAKAEYANSFASMSYEDKLSDEDKFDYPELDRLAVQGIGGAQHAAGENIWDLYFCGDSMSDESRRSSIRWASTLDSDLGGSCYLFSNGRSVGSIGRCAHIGPWGPWSGLDSARNSLSLIKVLTAELDLSLRHEVSADEMVSARVAF